MKRLFTLFSILAIVHLSALAGLAGYAWSRGWLTRDRVLRAAAVIQGQEELASGSSDGTGPEAEPPRSAGEQIQRNVESEERVRIELSRREREIKDGWKLLELGRLALLHEKEAHEATQERFAAQRESQAKQAGDSGVQKELEILSGIKPKEAKELLKLKEDADVVRVLMAMETRKARKIVSACKTSEERSWIERVLGNLHEQNAAQAEALGAGS